jgi:nucleoside-diphosphate-sugar epimerase
MIAPERVLLTGATGYIGSRLARRFVERGHTVSIICRPNSSFGLIDSIKEKIEIYPIDGSFASINNVIQKSCPDLVIHIASLFLTEHQPSQVKDILRSNVEFPSLLLEAMFRNRVFHFINTNTSWQYFEPDINAYHPTNLYAASKQAYEDILKYYVEACGFSALSLTLYDTFGTDDPRKKLFSLFAKASGSCESVNMSSGLQKIDLVYIDDVVEAFFHASHQLLESNSNSTYANFTVRTNQPRNLREIAATYESISGRPLKINWGALPHRRREIFMPWEVGVILPNWTAKISLEDGIRRLLNSKVAI